MVGADASPLKAVFRLAIVPVATNEEKPVAPVVKLNPVVGPGVGFPCDADSESESKLLPAAASNTEFALVLPLE